jgi:hypothetical protein
MVLGPVKFGVGFVEVRPLAFGRQIASANDGKDSKEQQPTHRRSRMALGKSLYRLCEKSCMISKSRLEIVRFLQVGTHTSVHACIRSALD